MARTPLSITLTMGLIAAMSVSANAVPIQTTDGLIETTAGTASFGEVGQYVSGGGGLTGQGLTYPLDAGDGINNVSQEASNIDQFWLNFDATGDNGPGAGSIIFNFNFATSDILAVSGIDGALPSPAYEALEFIVWGWTGSAWEEGAITAIFDDGVDAAWAYDDLSSVWSFSDEYTQFAVSGGTHYAGPDGTCFACTEGEIDGLAAYIQVPEPGTMALLGMGLLGAMIARRRRS